jgi:hypothetical protein
VEHNAAVAEDFRAIDTLHRDAVDRTTALRAYAAER